MNIYVALYVFLFMLVIGPTASLYISSRTSYIKVVCGLLADPTHHFLPIIPLMLQIIMLDDEEPIQALTLDILLHVKA